MAIIGPDGAQVQVNDRLCAITGFSREELVGRMPPFPYWPPEQVDAIRAALEATLRSEGPQRHRLTFVRRDGERFPSDVLTAPVRDSAGALVGYVGTMRDVTARRWAERALLGREERFRAMADSAPAMLWTADLRGAMTFLNGVWLRFRGRSLAEESGDGWLEGVHPDERLQVMTRLRQAVAARRPFTDEYQVRTAGGDYRWIADSGVPREADGRVVDYIGSRVDVTERHTAEEELRGREAAHRALAREQAALRRVATAVAGGADPPSLFRLVAAEAGGLLDGDTARVVRFSGEEAVVMGAWGADPPPDDSRLHLRGRRSLALVRQTGRAARVDDYGSLLREDPDSRDVVPPEYRAGLSAPVMAGGRLWGALLVARIGDRPPFVAEDEHRLTEFADLAGLAVANAEALRHLDRQARTDPLTGLANHRVFYERLEAEGARAVRHGRPLSVAVLDLDNFKMVNDTHGHAAGDRVLREVARRLLSLAREGELVARIGGEEVAWILPETDGAGGLAAAERARLAIAATPFEDVGTVTVSAGVADLGQARTPSAMMTLADGALYWAKARGRNMACRYTPDVVPDLSAGERSRRIERERALAALRSLAQVNDARHGAAAGHAGRVADLAAQLAMELGWGEREIARLTEAAVLHDIGTIGLPEGVRDDAAGAARAHPVTGAEMAGTVLADDQVAWLRGHHERVDGGGFPDGLAGTQIPVGAQILALAEAWDTLTWLAPEGDRRTAASALAECRREAGRAFAPAVVAALERIAAAGELPPARR